MAAFAEADHQPRLADHLRRTFGNPAEYLHRPLVSPRATHLPVEPRHRLDVVVVHLGPGVDDSVDLWQIATKIRGQDLDRWGSVELAQTLDAGDKTSSPAVGEIVTIDRRDHNVLETHLDHRLDQLPRLVGVEGGRSSVGDRAVGAVACTNPAVDQKCRRTARKALATVGAPRLFADRVQAARSHALLDLVELSQLHPARANPGRQSRPRCAATKGHGATTQASGKPAALIRWETRSAEPRSGKGPRRSLYKVGEPSSCTVMRCWFSRGKPRPSSLVRADSTEAFLDEAST